MKKTVWKSILCALLVTLTACILCIGAFAAKYPCIKSAAAERRIRTLPTVGYIALPNLPPRAALLTAPNLRTAALTQAIKNPTRRMIPMTMATMPSMMMTTTMRIATTATRTTQQA